MASEYEPTDQPDDHQQDTGQPDTSAEALEQGPDTLAVTEQDHPSPWLEVTP